MEHFITTEALNSYAAALRQEERSSGTIENYLRAVRAFMKWAADAAVTQETATAWKNHLMEQGYAPVTINAMLAALNSFFRFAKLPLKMKYLKVQRRLFRAPEKELTKEEYNRLLYAAKTEGKPYLALLMETICATGIRVSELKYITVAAAQAGQAEIAMKGKICTILLPEKLCRKLLKYVRKQKIISGEIFLAKSGRGISRRQIWKELKDLCAKAGVAKSKVFPHNLRHLFAATFYRAYHDIASLADILGHSSIETTRIYLALSGTEYRRRLDCLGLVY